MIKQVDLYLIINKLTKRESSLLIHEQVVTPNSNQIEDLSESTKLLHIINLTKMRKSPTPSRPPHRPKGAPQVGMNKFLKLFIIGMISITQTVNCDGSAFLFAQRDRFLQEGDPNANQDPPATNSTDSPPPAGEGAQSTLSDMMTQASAALDQLQIRGPEQQTLSTLTGASGQNSSFQQANVSNSIDMQRYRASYANEVGQVLVPSIPAIDNFIKTDKPVYQPGDVMFIEIYLVDTFFKKPITSQYSPPGILAYPFDTYYISQYSYGSISILDPLDVEIYSQSTYAVNGTLSFTYITSDKAVGGEYKILSSGSNMPDAIQKFRIRQYEQQPLVVQGEFDQESNQPGSNVTMALSVKTQTGSSFTTLPSYTYVVNFGDNQTQVNGSGRFNSQGRAVISFLIPADFNQTQATVAVSVKSQSTIVPFTRTLVVVNPSAMVIDFYPETYSYAFGVPNKIYFQAFSNSERTLTVEIQQAALLSLSNSGNGEEVTIVGNLETANLGRGYFEFVPQQGNQYFMTVPNQGSNDTTRFNLNITQYEVDIDDQELQFSVVRKVVANDDALVVRIFANAKMVSTDVYILGIYIKERGLYFEQLQFQPSTSYEITVAASQFDMFNGGVMRVQILRVIRPLIWYERFAYLSQGVQPINYTSIFPINDTRSNETVRNNISAEALPKSPRTQLDDPFYVYYSIPRGELLFFKRPSEVLSVKVTTEKQQYMPGDLVNFQVTITSPNNSNSSNSTAEVPKYVSVFVTDDSVFRQLPLRNQPPSRPAQVFLEKEIILRDYEFVNSHQYVDQWYISADAIQNMTADERPSDLKLDLLLGCQGWRLGFFYPQVIQEWPSAVVNMTDENRYLLESVFAYKFTQQPAFPIARPVFNTGVGQGTASGAGADSGSNATAAISGSGSASVSSQAPIPANPNLGGESAATTSGAPSQVGTGGQEITAGGLTLSEREQLLWQLIKDTRNQQIQPTSRYFANTQRLSFLSDVGSRFDLTETLFYTSANYTGADGIYKGSFILSDLITQFRFTANAFDAAGRLGFGNHVITSQKAFYQDFIMPAMLVQGDSLQIPITLYNTLADQSLNARLTLLDYTYQYINASLVNEGDIIEMPENSQANDTLTVTALNLTLGDEKAFVQVRAQAVSNETNIRYQDSLIKEFIVVSQGVEQIAQQGGFISNSEPTVNFTFEIPASAVEGTVQLLVEFYPVAFDDLFAALRRVIIQPIVCTYCLEGNILIRALLINFAKQSNNQESQDANSKDTAAKPNFVQTLGLSSNDIESVQAELQTQLGDFENNIQGQQSASIIDQARQLQILSAAGLSSTDPIFQSTLNSLIGERGANGQFSKATLPPYYTSSYPDYVVDAYIVWVLTEVGYTDLTAEINHLIDVATQQTQQGATNVNTFFFALLSASLYNLNRTSEAQVYADFLASIQDPVTGAVQSTSSFFSTDQIQSTQETTAMASIAWENDFSRYSSNLQKSISYLVAVTYIGDYWYPTPLSYLSLRAIIRYVAVLAPIEGTADLVVTINGQQVESETLTPETTDTVAIVNPTKSSSNLTSLQQPGQSNIVVLSVENYIPQNASSDNFTATYRIVVSWQDTQPKSSNMSDLGFSVVKAAQGENSTSTIGSITSYNVTVFDKNDTRGIGLVVVIFRPPSCYQLNFDLFETLRAQGIIDDYEFKSSNTEAWLYINKLAPAQVLSFNLDLIRIFLGTCMERPQEAFEYFIPTQRQYVSFNQTQQ